MNKTSLLALLLVSGALTTPAYANFFHNPYTGINLNVGSAPNPTPADIRENRLPVVTQDDSSVTPPVADAGSAATKPSAPVAQTQTQPASGAKTVASANQSR
jgi:hypothetical protein